jgi:hypothetical protein
MNPFPWLKRSALIGLIAALALGAAPMTGVYAAGPEIPSASPGQDEAGDRLERAWAHHLKVYARQGRLLEKADKLIHHVERLLERAEEKGRETAALQAALDVFKRAVNLADTIYREAGEIVAAHAGFDDSGQVTDPEQAAETVKELAAKLQEIRATVGEPGKALHDAIQAFREANRP